MNERLTAMFRGAGTLLIGLLLVVAGCESSRTVPRSPDDVEPYRTPAEHTGSRNTNSTGDRNTSSPSSRSSASRTDNAPSRSSGFSGEKRTKNTTTASSSDTGPASPDITRRLKDMPDQNHPSLDDVKWPESFDRRVQTRFREHLKRRGWIEERDAQQESSESESNNSSDRTDN